jgi:rare lipoprotein A
MVAVALLGAATFASMAQASSRDLVPQAIAPRGALGAAAVSQSDAQPTAQPTSAPARLPVQSKPWLDRTGKRRIGKASFYAHQFEGRKMADGRRMDPQHNNAASRTLPLGTTAKVTNLKTGQSAVVTIQDRGPYVSGRIVDLSPATAEEIGITRREGVTKVEVAPITVPQPDGSVKLGAAAGETFARNDRPNRQSGW